MPDDQYPPPGAAEPNRGPVPPAPAATPPTASPSTPPAAPGAGQWAAPGSQPPTAPGAGGVPGWGAPPPGGMPPGGMPAGGMPPGAWPPPPGGYARPFPGPPPAARPGAVPLRPLRLGDLLDGTVRIIRRNAGATVGAALLVSAIALLIPAVVTAATATLFDFSSWGSDDVAFDGSDAEFIAFLVTVGSWVIGFVAQSLATVLVAGMCAHVALAAATGRTMSLGEAWAATHGHRWRLIGAGLALGLLMTLVVGLVVSATVFAGLYGGWQIAVPVGVVGGVAGVAVLVWMWVRLSLLLTPVIAVEKRRIGAALGRAHALTAGHFWRLFGISLLVLLLLQVVSSIITVPIAVVSVIPSLSGASPATDLLVQAASQGIAVALTSALVTPFSGVLGGLFLLDLRMRKEAYDVELLQMAHGAGTTNGQPGASVL